MRTQMTASVGGPFCVDRSRLRWASLVGSLGSSVGSTFHSARTRRDGLALSTVPLLATEVGVIRPSAGPPSGSAPRIPYRVGQSEALRSRGIAQSLRHSDECSVGGYATRPSGVIFASWNWARQRN